MKVSKALWKERFEGKLSEPLGEEIDNFETDLELRRQGKLDEKTALLRQEPNKLDELLHPVFDKEAIKSANVVAKGLPAYPGAVRGKVVFSAEDAVEESKKDRVILVRLETSPEDIGGMNVSEGILTARGGMTSHAAVVARGMGKSCIAGCGALTIDYEKDLVLIENLQNLQGVYLEKTAKREYADGEVFSSILGYTGKISEEELKTMKGYSMTDYIGKNG